MNKSADLKTMTIIMAGISIGVLVLIFSLSIGNSFFDMLFPDVSQLTINSLDSLEEVINNLENGENETFMIYMSKGYYLVSFNNNLNDPNFGSGELGYYSRPSGCFQSSCLIICKANDAKNACNPPMSKVKKFNLDSFETDNIEKGVITYTVDKYVNLYIERADEVLVIHDIT